MTSQSESQLTPLILNTSPKIPFSTNFFKYFAYLFFGIIIIWLLAMIGRSPPKSRYTYDYLRYECEKDSNGRSTGNCVANTTLTETEGYKSQAECELAYSCWKDSDQANEYWTCDTKKDDQGNIYNVGKCIKVIGKEAPSYHRYPSEQTCVDAGQCLIKYPYKCVYGKGCEILDLNQYDANNKHHYNDFNACKESCKERYGCNTETQYQCQQIITDKGVDEAYYDTRDDCPASCTPSKGGYTPSPSNGLCVFDPNLKNPTYSSSQYGACVTDSCKAVGNIPAQGQYDSTKWICCRPDENVCGDTCCSSLDCKQCIVDAEGKKKCVTTLQNNCQQCINGNPSETDYGIQCTIFNNEVCGCNPLSYSGTTPCPNKSCYRRICINGRPAKFSSTKKVKIIEDGKEVMKTCGQISNTSPPD